jgi:hypothetical protein
MRNPAHVFLFLLAAILFSSPAAAAVQNRVESDSLRPLRGLRAGTRATLEHIPLGDGLATLEVERFEVWAPGAAIVIEHGDGRRESIAPPAVQYFRGTVANDPDSMVFVALRGDGAMEGSVVFHDRRYRMKSRNTSESKDVFVEELGLLDEQSETPFSCELDHAPLVVPRGVPTVRGDGLGENVATNGTLSATGTWTLNLAIETDFELFQDLGSNAASVTTFIGNLVAQASIIYQRDLRTDLLIAFMRVQAAAADPFTVVPGSTGTWNGASTTYSTSHALAELGDVWANAGTRPYSGPRSSVVLVSGKNQTAGVAWTARSCQGDFACSGGNCGSALFDGHTGGAYAYLGLGNQSTATVPDPNATTGSVQYGLPSSNYWALLGFAHELGHNVDGPHTHCVSLTAEQKTQYGVTRNFIDECVTGCFSGTTSVPPEKGSIMSYCHLLGTSQSRFTFGRAFETSELMVNRIRSYINSRTPASPAISAPSAMNAAASSTASITSPASGLTYTWSIINGTINGATTGSSVNFTATANPVTLRVRGTNASGCAASETRTVTVNSCIPPVLTSVSSGATITLGSAVNLEAVATGAGPITYQWYVGTPGNTSVPAAAGNPISASPSTTTSYWVRATNACGSVDSGAVNIAVVAPPLTPTSLYVISPCRLIDTRGSAGPGGGPALASGTTRDVQVTGRCGVPAGAKSIVANVTAVAPATNGFLSLYATGISWPGISTLSYRVGRTRANSALLMLSADGQVRAYNVGSTQNFIIDVTGYFQ